MNLKDTFRKLQNPLGVHPINWSNDDFKDLGGDTPLQICFQQMHEAGYMGTEVGHKYPRDVAELKSLIGRYRLRLIGGWHSTYFAMADHAGEERKFLEYLRFLKAMNASVVIVAECSKSIHGDESAPLDFSPPENELSQVEWAKVYEGLDRLSRLGAAEGLPVVYHHHMGTVVQSESSLDALMANTQHLNLLFDTGHLSFAGIDPIGILDRFYDRIAHVHLKNVRPPVVREARAAGFSFGQAVRAGVFTVPGDEQPGEPSVDYPIILEKLASHGYTGWYVVEAEQDPARADPFEYAHTARQYLQAITGL